MASLDGASAETALPRTAVITFGANDSFTLSAACTDPEAPFLLPAAAASAATASIASASIASASAVTAKDDDPRRCCHPSRVLFQSAASQAVTLPASTPNFRYVTLFPCPSGEADTERHVCLVFKVRAPDCL